MVLEVRLIASLGDQDLKGLERPGVVLGMWVRSPRVHTVIYILFYKYVIL